LTLPHYDKRLSALSPFGLKKQIFKLPTKQYKYFKYEIMFTKSIIQKTKKGEENPLQTSRNQQKNIQNRQNSIFYTPIKLIFKAKIIL